MAIFRPFDALCPIPERAASVAALPYDVMSSQEARVIASGNPYSFLHVDKAEIDLDPSVGLYDDAVYKKAAANLRALEEDGVCVQSGRPCFYIYRLIWRGVTQTGLVGCASVDDYLNDVIKKHELTRADKEADRIAHVDTCDANTGPIFLIYRDREGVDVIIEEWAASHAPEYDFKAEDEVRHMVWVIDDNSIIEGLREKLANTPNFYIADGHHRAASAVRVGQRRRDSHPGYTGSEEFNFFLAVLFPADQTAILPYNRLVRDLNGLSVEEFLLRVGEKFVCKKSPSPVDPLERHGFGMYLDGKWYELKAKDGTFEEKDPVACLDVSILQNNILAPILDIGDPRTDKRIEFVGGIRGLKELENRVDSDMAVAFSMYPTSTKELMEIADNGLLMPPKSTWFEPKLRSGLFIHKLS